MAKKKKKNRSQQPQKPAANQARAERTVPKFEIGVKGDEFDVAYTRAAKKEQNRAEALFRSISKESDRVAADLVCFAVLALLAIFMSLSFAFLSRTGKFPSLRAQTIADGSFLSGLKSYYSDTLPLGPELSKLGNALGLCELRDKPTDPDEEPDDDEQGEEPANTEQPAVTEPVVTTAEATTTVTTTTPATTTVTTTVPETTTEPVTEPETTRMYARGTIQVRLEPDSDSMIMGYYYRNERVQVIRIRDDGWAEIWFGGAVMYVEADGVSERRTSSTTAETTVETTAETTAETTTEPETATEPPVTTAEPETEPPVTTVEDAAEETTTTASRFQMDSLLSMLLGRQTTAETEGESSAETAESAE